MLNISLVFRKYLCSFYAQQSNKVLPCFAFLNVFCFYKKKKVIKMSENQVNYTNEKKYIFHKTFK
jgi:hypothetical protein